MNSQPISSIGELMLSVHEYLLLIALLIFCCSLKCFLIVINTHNMAFITCKTLSYSSGHWSTVTAGQASLLRLQDVCAVKLEIYAYEVTVPISCSPKSWHAPSFQPYTFDCFSYFMKCNKKDVQAQYLSLYHCLDLLSLINNYFIQVIPCIRIPSA